MASIEERVIKIICDQLHVNKEDLAPGKRFIEDIGADSLDLVEMVMAFEESFGIEVPDTDQEKIRTVGDAVEYVKSKASGGGKSEVA